MILFLLAFFIKFVDMTLNITPGMSIYSTSIVTSIPVNSNRHDCSSLARSFIVCAVFSMHSLLYI